MAYIKTSWVARVGTALNRFLKTNESAGSVELTNDPTGVTTAGTPFTVANMNKIEQGIYDAHEALDANGISLATPRIDQGVKTTDSPEFAGVTLSGAMSPSVSPTGISQNAPYYSLYILPRGVFMLALFNTSLTLQIQVEGEWRDTMYNMGGCIFSDGVNVRVFNNTPDAHTFYALRF